MASHRAEGTLKLISKGTEETTVHYCRKSLSRRQDRSDAAAGELVPPLYNSETWRDQAVRLTDLTADCDAFRALLVTEVKLASAMSEACLAALCTLS